MIYPSTVAAIKILTSNSCELTDRMKNVRKDSAAFCVFALPFYGGSVEQWEIRQLVSPKAFPSLLSGTWLKDRSTYTYSHAHTVKLTLAHTQPKNASLGL